MADFKAMKLVDQSPAHPTIERNPGMPLDLQWVRDVRINRSAVERRASALGTRRTVKKQWQAAWLIRAIQCMDLTTLSGDDTPGNVMRLCAKAKSPVRPDLLTDLGLGDTPIHTAAVCVSHNFIPVACKAVKGTPMQVAAVSTGFPAAHIPLEHKTQQIRDAVALGATEIDIVISRNLVLTGDWEGLYEEVKAYREACGEADHHHCAG